MKRIGMITVTMICTLLLAACGGSSMTQETSSAVLSSSSSGQTTTTQTKADNTTGATKSTISAVLTTTTQQPSAISTTSRGNTTTATSHTTTATTTTKTTTTTTVFTTTTTARQEVTVTIPEGYSFMQVARLLEQKGVCSAADFHAVCEAYTPQSFTIPIHTDRCFRMEGYLFPDTYRFYVGDNPKSVLIRLLNNFRTKVGDIDDDTLILASIIEREARSDKHMKLVSSVFHNRLNNKREFLYLNADPTRDYVNQYITGNPLVKDTDRFAALYNTCGKRVGLPAGPICNPGLRAIRAAQQPTESPYYYFFYGKDFDNHYSVTLQEHEDKMAQIGVENG